MVMNFFFCKFLNIFSFPFADDCGDHVVVINTKEIALPGDEWVKRVYFHHTGYPGGASWTLAWQLHDKDPTMVMHKAVYNSMKGNLQRRHTMQRLHLFADDNVPEEILANVTNQIRTPREVPQRLDHIDKETLENFPSIMDYPKDYILR
ncbi:39S ribosomal protein L13, mitochondrial-like [Lucilia cuprina]|uniref:39S ribosomal protein L13, mitochondrial-like n=1 Tax=Lucilia cuprina TaxID=7375 RepID=UPI001F05F7CF|nr:39S ribosomal protein L13, mitochondrial-like [Lucilia cuprina]